jgi:Tol biopolymer transport system component
MVRAAVVIGICSCGMGFAVSPSSAIAACSNDAFRTGASAALPDCRAYELITPPDTVGRMFYTIESELPYNLFPTELMSSSGDSALFMTKGAALREPSEANGTHDLYEADRTASGWRVARLLTPSGAESALPNVGGVPSDHRYTFIEARPGLPNEFAGSLGEDGDATYLGNPDGSFEPLGLGSIGNDRLVQGRFISEGGTHVIFTTGGEWCSFTPCDIAQLEPDAPPTGTATVYDRSADGPTHVVSLLPGDITPGAGENADYQGTSTDGSVVAFKVGGTLYARVDNAETKEVTAQQAVFAGISSGGDRIFYVSGGNIYAFSIDAGETRQVNSTGDAEVVNISPDGSHVYFVSPSALPNTTAEPGQPNLYLWTGGDEQTDFIATVSPDDLLGTGGRPALNKWTSHAVNPEKTIGQGPGADSSRTTPDGSVLIFESRAQLTDYESQGHVEIYRYDSNSQNLQCVSCNSNGDPATANARLEALESFGIGGESMVIHNLSSDGSRVFFESSEGLVNRDIDGVNDIYEWQAASGGGGSTLDLISSGQSVYYTNPTIELEFQEPNVMFAVTADGSDVIFRTVDQLVEAAGSGGTPALYDARVGGGFPEAPRQPCKSQVCDGGGSSPAALLDPQSDVFQGAGNVKRHHYRCRRARSGRKAAKHRSCHPRRHRKGSAR